VCTTWRNVVQHALRDIDFHHRGGRFGIIEGYAAGNGLRDCVRRSGSGNARLAALNRLRLCTGNRGRANGQNCKCNAADNGAQSDLVMLVHVFLQDKWGSGDDSATASPTISPLFGRKPTFLAGAKKKPRLARPDGV
jgi:hypothetical protein